MEKGGMILRRYAKFIICSILLLALSGCDFLWNISNRGTLERYLQEIAKENGLIIAKPACNMFKGSRVGYCRFNARPEAIDVFVSRLELMVIKKGIECLPSLGNPYPDVLLEDIGARKIYELENRFHCIQICKFDNKKNLIVYGRSPSSKDFRSSSGIILDFYALYYDLVTHDACIVAGFKYG